MALRQLRQKCRVSSVNHAFEIFKELDKRKRDALSLQSSVAKTISNEKFIVLLEYLIMVSKYFRIKIENV